ncbi:MAG: DUF456 domain-containing protein [Candidatus Goldbacteria bacterium]|nr:DUF456 domain-containing protein [Candidatus Goldiibacteriota bacterium]
MFDYILISAGIILMIIGLVGCIVPVIPGTPLCFIGLLLLHFSLKIEFSVFFLIVMGILTILSSTLDNLIPALSVKKAGGSKKAVSGVIIGVLTGFFFMPWGIIIFPFLGALIAELLSKKNIRSALKSSLGAFIGFIIGVALKITVASTMLFYGIKELLK